jgi:hypothetical protein
VTKAWAVCLVLAVFAGSLVGAVSCTSGGGAPLSYVRHFTNDDDDNDDNDDNDNDNDDNDTAANEYTGYFISVWGSSGSDVFAGGWTGVLLMLHYDGSSWSIMPSWDEGYATGIWGTSQSDVFAAAGDVSHYDGSAWSVSDDKVDAFGLWGDSHSDVYAVGSVDDDANGAWHFDGASWAEMAIQGPGNGLDAVWGISASNVFAGGCIGSGGCAQSTLLHYDGSSWSEIVGAEYSQLVEAIWGSSASDVFAATVGGANGIVLHYDGSNWSTFWTGSDLELRTVFGTSSSDVFAGGCNTDANGDCLTSAIFHYDGSSWSAMPGGELALEIFGLWAASPDDVFAVGEVGGTDADYCIILHYDGSSWSVMWGPGAETGKR